MSKPIHSVDVLMLKFKDKILDFIVKFFGEHASDSLGYCATNGLSINEYKPDETFIDQTTGKGKGQKTVFLSARLFDLWENAMFEMLKHLLSLNGQEKEVNYVKRSATSFGDLVFFEETWEIKSSQANNSWTSATHSTQKCPNYILIHYILDLDYKMNRFHNSDLLNGILLFLANDIQKNDWHGEHTDHSSFTTFKINRDMNIVKIIGDYDFSQKYAKLKHVMRPKEGWNDLHKNFLSKNKR